jgi:4-amino-4-deoxy-L-arabinose transferase-like glycosyltransferase
MTDRGAWLRWLLPLVLVVVAAALRLIALPTRGPWDGDQGAHLLAVLHLVRDGEVPLLGPGASIGGLHHGALYTYVLAPSAAMSGTDPTVVTLTFVAAGVGVVLICWWLARSIGGELAGAIAGLLTTVAAVGVAESSGIWNPFLVPFASGLALAGAWAAAGRGRPWGWAVAGLGLGAAIQFHLVAAVIGPPLAILWVLEARRATGEARRAIVRAGAVGSVLVLLGFVPLLVHELTTDYSELRAAIAWLTGGGAAGADGPGVLVRALLVPLRIAEWPLVGLFVDALPLAVLVAAGVVAALVWRWRVGAPAERGAAAFGLATLIWSWGCLVVVTPSLGTVVRELPVDHYHAFLDPIVIVAASAGLAAIAARDIVGRVLAAGGVVVLVGWNLATQPPLEHPSEGWPAGEVAGERIVATANGEPIAFIGLPDFKAPDAYVFPVDRAGATIVDDASALPADGLLVVVCETLFREAIGADCGGPAELEAIAPLAPVGGRPSLVDQFEAAPGRFISLYRIVSR